jgi:hypothetical protein
MKKAFNLGIAFWGAIVFVVAGALSLPASADTADPVVVANSGTLSPATAGPGSSITATWRVTDDIECCDFHRIHVIPETMGTFDAVAYFDGITQVSGTGTDGIYTKTFNLPNALSPGIYDIRVQVTDKAGKFSSNVTVAKLTVTVTSQADLQNPVVVPGSGTLSKTSVLVGESLTVTWRVTDDLDCCDFNRVNFVTAGNPSNNVLAFFSNPSRISGDGTNGTYSRTFSAPNLAVGNYDLRAQVTDKAGKYSSMITVATVAITAANTTDTTRPTITGADSAISPQTVDAGQSSVITVNVSDAGGCCSSVVVRLVSTTGTTYPNQVMTRISGTDNVGTYRATIPTTSSMVPGNHFVVVTARDNAGNEAPQSIGFLNVTPDNDVTAPVVQSSFISTSTTQAGSTVEFVSGGPFFARINVSDNSDCCQSVAVRFLNSAGGAVWNLTATKVSGDSFQSTYEVSTTINAGIVPSTLRVVAVATDAAGNVSTQTQIGTAVIKAANTSDTQNPVVVLNSGTVSKASVKQGEQLTVTWRVTDDLDCCDFNRINIMTQRATNPENMGFFDGAVRISGDGKNGTYSKTFAVPSNLPAGDYSLRAQATDKVGKFTKLDEVANFRVVSALDAANPVVVSGSGVVFPSSAAPGDKVTLLYQVTDDLDCCNPHDAYMYDSSGNWVVRNQAVLVSGTKTNATYRVEFTLPSSITAGTYTFKSQVTDKAGKFSQLQELGSVRVSVQDTQNPLVVPTSATLSSTAPVAGDVLTVSYRATDNIGGFSPHDAFVYDSNNNLVLRAPASAVSGGALDTTFRASFSLFSSLATGQYTVRTQVTDNAGNYSNLQLLGTFSFTNQSQQRPEIVNSTGLASPSLVQPGSIVRIGFTVLNDSNDVTARALVQDSSARTIAFGFAIRLFRGIGSSQYYADVRVPVDTEPGDYVFAATVIDGKTGFSSRASFGSFTVQTQPSQLAGPRNLRLVDGGGLSPSSMVWDAPVATTGNPVLSYTAQALTADGTWNDFCSSNSSSRSCFLYNRTLNNKPIVAYRVAAIGTQGAGSYVSISQPASLTFVGDPIATPATQPTVISSSAVLNVGTFNGKIVVYAKGMRGSTLSWKIAGKWQKATVTKDFQRFDRPTRAIGLRVGIELFVNGTRSAAFSKSVVTK